MHLPSGSQPFRIRAAIDRRTFTKSEEVFPFRFGPIERKLGQPAFVGRGSSIALNPIVLDGVIGTIGVVPPPPRESWKWLVRDRAENMQEISE
jgi:hypothetical protein